LWLFYFSSLPPFTPATTPGMLQTWPGGGCVATRPVATGASRVPPCPTAILPRRPRP
jgi:hypothetical protein